MADEITEALEKIFSFDSKFLSTSQGKLDSAMRPGAFRLLKVVVSAAVFLFW